MNKLEMGKQTLSQVLHLCLFEITNRIEAVQQPRNTMLEGFRGAKTAEKRYESTQKGLNKLYNSRKPTT
jgi:hypothetical protein